MMELYRYADGFDEEPYLYTFHVIKETPGGYWVTCWEYLGSHKRWMSKYAYKRFAWETKKEALDSYIIRKQKHIEILKNKLYHIETLLNSAMEMRLNDPKTRM